MGITQREFIEDLKSEKERLKRQLKDTVKLKDIEIRELRWELKKLGDELRELEKQQEWQVVDSSLKEHTSWLVYYDGTGEYYVSWKSRGNNWFIDDGGGLCEISAPSHYMSLPQAPKGE